LSVSRAVSCASASPNAELPSDAVAAQRRNDTTSITDGGSVGGDRKLKESTTRLAPGCPQPSTMGFDDRAADGEPHAHAVGLGRVEGFKKTRQALRAQPVAGIPHRDADALRLDTHGADV